MRKWIDPCLGSGLGSARRHDGGRPRDKLSIAVITSVKPPDRLFSPLETSSLTVWLSGNRAKINASWWWRPKQVDFAGKRKKIKLCAARRYPRVSRKGSNLQTTMRGSRNHESEFRHPDLKFLIY